MDVAGEGACTFYAFSIIHHPWEVHACIHLSICKKVAFGGTEKACLMQQEVLGQGSIQIPC